MPADAAKTNPMPAGAVLRARLEWQHASTEKCTQLPYSEAPAAGPTANESADQAAARVANLSGG